jgi:hypothetical protein
VGNSNADSASGQIGQDAHELLLQANDEGGLEQREAKRLEW